MEHRDAVIVGAGPAGSTCAWKLRQAGLDVLVVDRQRFPRDKTCAGWITPGVLEALEVRPEDYGRGRVIEPITAFRIGMIGGRAIGVRYGRAVSFGIRRVELDHFLIERSGAVFRPGTAVRSVERRGVAWIVNDEISTPVIVGAGGHSCPVAKLLNPAAEAEPLVLTQEAEVAMDAERDGCVETGVPEFYFTKDFSGYGWILRKGRYATVGLGRRDPHHLRAHAQAFVEFLRHAGRAPTLCQPAWRGHAYLLYGTSARRLVFDGGLLVGDAGGFAHPSSGEGIEPAVESGVAAAETIVEAAGDYRESRLAQYRERIETRLGRANGGRGLRKLIPRSVEHAIGRRLVTMPWFARRVVLDRWFLHQ